MACKALKLDVPLPAGDRRRLCVKDEDGCAVLVDDSHFRNGHHVEPLGSSALLVKNFFEESNKVPDVSRYFISNDRELVYHRDTPASWLQLQRSCCSIVLLLESPNTEEYQYGNIGCPIAPAKGPTGTNIHKCLRVVLSKIRDNLNNDGLNANKHIEPGSHVIISNPIQFQTSLYAIHEQPLRNNNKKTLWGYLRDHVWRTLWRQDYIKKCFLARLYRYNPSIIINACTKDQRLDVSIFVQRKLPTVTLYQAHHPAVRWSSCDNTGLERIYPPANPNAANPPR